MPPSLVELIESRIGALPTPVGDVVDALAVGEPIELAALRRITDPAAVHEKIENALRRSAEFEATHIGVSMSGHKATLRGKVRSWWERRAAESAAWSAPGVTEVDNQLIIGN